MTNVLIIFLVIIILLGILMAIAVMTRHGKGTDIDRQYLDEDNDHIYYDRSIIEKKQFRKNNPNSGEPRTFSRLFGRKSGSRNV